MKTRRFIVTVFGETGKSDREIEDAIFDALEVLAKYDDASALYDCAFMVSACK